jgi:hypothetical protein
MEGRIPASGYQVAFGDKIFVAIFLLLCKTAYEIQNHNWDIHENLHGTNLPAGPYCACCGHESDGLFGELCAFAGDQRCT